jgi:hypothetical protein
MLGEERPMKIRDALIDELLAGQDPSTVMNHDGLMGALKKALMNRMLAAEFVRGAKVWAVPLIRRIEFAL